MKRLPYEKAVQLRPSGVCHCDLDDRHCYEAGHWEAQRTPFMQREASGLVSLVGLALFIGSAAVLLACIK